MNDTAESVQITDSKWNYGRATRLLCAANNLKWSELADAAGLSRALISYIANGQRKPSLTTLEKIAETVGVPMTLLMTLASPVEDIGHEELGAALAAALSVGEAEDEASAEEEPEGNEE